MVQRGLRCKLDYMLKAADRIVVLRRIQKGRTQINPNDAFRIFIMKFLHEL